MRPPASLSPARLLLLAVLVVLAAAVVAARQQRQLRIAGGWNAPRRRYPWVVSLRRPTGSRGHFCGGTLIAPRLVLTAAHCLWDKSRGKWTDQKPQVRIGGYELGGGGYEQRRAVALALPLAFNAATTNHDAALVLLDRPSMQRPIRLAAARPDPKWAMQQGTVLWVLGWGRLRWGGPQPRYLQEASLNYLSPKTCARYLPALDWQRNKMICAGWPSLNRDSCSGDSGGALFRRGANAASDLQVGIVSWGVQCGEYDTPGVYGNVASMQVFIGAGARQLLSWQPKGGRRSARELGAAEAAAMEAELAAAAALGLLDGGGAGGAVNSSDVFIHSWSAPA